MLFESGFGIQHTGWLASDGAVDGGALGDADLGRVGAGTLVKEADAVGATVVVVSDDAAGEYGRGGGNGNSLHLEVVEIFKLLNLPSRYDVENLSRFPRKKRMPAERVKRYVKRKENRVRLRLSRC